MDFSLTPEQQALRAMARRLAVERFAPKAFTWKGFAWENARILASLGLTGITLAPEDGGQGGSLLDAVLVMEAVSEVCPHSGDAVQATNFGAIRQVSTFGSAAVKRDVLPLLLSGEGLISAGMSEAEAGSALTDLRTTARYEGDEVVLNGEKLWSSYAPEITHSVVWARFGPRARDIGCVVVPVTAPGFSKGVAGTYMSGEHHGALYMEECRVPRSYVLADSDALRTMFTVFGIERIGNATRALSLAQAAFDRAVAHAKTRTQFGRPLCEFQGLQWRFADMRMKLDAARLLIYRAVQNADDGAPDPAEAAIAKCFANEAAFEIANQALQVFGASGYSTEYPMEYYVRRTRGWMIAGGSVEMMRNHVAEAVFDRRFPRRP
ncbi:acyl-CoA dehydrogenase family protein [Tenggerimyces flavus]|uniref:Acyl-CoA dehydrogenase family protein n=1 Tax=Tenggerimyces flavus TaxID=1708749 RepID=A0ABV7YAS7_9ACTN|nr:acyl-CoA dehydrogenase family protein [Tenggerimyces flavus]MBM7789780.1 alkylation response protein AidB-like acyl-CoA dehydrogenase [Tenggerimyces flavus]